MQNNDLIAARTAGHLLGKVRETVVSAITPGISFEELEKIAQREIKACGATPSFPTVEDYQWATCITKNEGCCHGIPRNKHVDAGDLITVDVGLVYGGMHADTASTVCAGSCSKEHEEFLQAGRDALKAAIKAAKPGNTIYDLGYAMQSTLESRGYSAVYQLTGHSIGRVLHMEPYIPCFADKRNKRYKLYAGQLLAIEVMYAAGDPTLELGKDGWTYQTVDKSITGMFEHTVLVTEKGPEILTLPTW